MSSTLIVNQDELKKVSSLLAVSSYKDITEAFSIVKSMLNNKDNYPKGYHDVMEFYDKDVQLTDTQKLENKFQSLELLVNKTDGTTTQCLNSIINRLDKIDDKLNKPDVIELPQPKKNYTFFFMATYDICASQKETLRDYFNCRSDNLKYWNWFPNTWIIVDMSNSLTAQDLKNTIKTLYPDLWILIVQFNEEPCKWSARGSGDGFPWLRKYLGTTMKEASKNNES